MITDKEINDFFTTNYKMLETIALGISYKNKRNINPSATVSESYLYIYKIKHKINTQDELQRFTIHWIKQMVGTWSTNNKLINDEGNKKIDSSYVPEEIDEFDDNLQSKVEIEIWYNERKCILEMYRAQEMDKVKAIIFDCYFNKGITKGRDMAKHLSINKDYSSRYIREMKQAIRDFHSQYNNKKDIL